MRHSLEVLRRIYDDEDGVYLEVGPDADSLDLVELRSSGRSEEFYGKVRLTMTPQQARLIAAALYACSDEMDAAVYARKEAK